MLMLLPEDLYMETDWNIITKKKPRGYVELNDTKEAVYGPIESITIDNNGIVELKVKWAVKRRWDLWEYHPAIG
jgi:hypothetical protein